MSNDCGIPLREDLELRAKDGVAALKLEDTSMRMAAFLKFQDQSTKLPSQDFWKVSARVLELNECDLPKVDIHGSPTPEKDKTYAENKNDFHRHQTIDQKVEILNKKFVKVVDELPKWSQVVRRVGEDISTQNSSSSLEASGVLPRTSFSDMTNGYRATATDQQLSKKLQMIDQAMKE